MSARRKKLSTMRTRAGRRRRILIERLEDRRLLAVFPNDPLFQSQWQLHNSAPPVNEYDADMDLTEAWAVTTGSYNTVVAVMDAGVDYTHEDLYLNIWLNQGEIPAGLVDSLSDVDLDGVISFFDLNEPENASFVEDLNDTGYIDGGDLLADPLWEDGLDTDGNGFLDDLVGWDFTDGDNDPHHTGIGGTNSHGTAQAGRIGAIGNNGVGMTGINWKASMMAVRHTNLEGLWEPSSSAAAIDYAVDMGSQISNNSWGGSGPYVNDVQPEVYDAIDRARQAGHLFVTGPGPYGDIHDIGLYSWSLYGLPNIMHGTGLTDQNELYQGWGHDVIHVAVPNDGSYATGSDNTYGTGSGGSATVAMTAGIAALVQSAHPHYDYQQLMDHIMATVDPLPNLQGLLISNGKANAAKAVGVVSNELFYDSFEAGQWNGLWVEDSQNDWFASGQRATEGHSSAEVDGRANDAMLTLANPIDLSSSLSAKVSFDWFIEGNWDSGERLSVDLFDGNTWTEWKSLDGNVVNEEGFWINETIELDSNYLTADFKMRFRAKVSGSNEDGNIDNVRVIAKQLPAAPSLSIDDQQVNEGDSGTTAVNFTVTRSGDTSGASSVDWSTADGTATTADSDYQPVASGTVQFVAGETTKTISVQVNGDMDFEGDETFVVDLSNPSNATIADDQGQGTIVNDDDLPPTLSIDDVSVFEGDSGATTASFTVTRSGDPNVVVSVDYETQNGSATTPADYVDIALTTLTFGIGETSKTVDVTVNGDELDEGDEEFYVNLSSPSAGASITKAQGVGTIQDDDAPVAPTMYVADLDATSTPASRGKWNATITVTVMDSSGNAVSDATVNFVWSNGATGSVTTDANGIAIVTRSNINKKTQSLTFTITSLVKTGFTYNADDNTDPDGDSDGTMITVNKP